MNDPTSDHLAWLQDKLSGYASKLSEAEATVAKFRPLVSNLRDVIEALTAEKEGPKPQRDIFGQDTKSLKIPFTRGNQNSKMPDRRPEYADRTLIESAAEIINAEPNILHANDITKAVFIIANIGDFALAKHSMASELYRGAKKGLWIALGKNQYKHN